MQIWPMINASLFSSGSLYGLRVLGEARGMGKTDPKEVELHPDAWTRFERAAGVVAKSPPQHRVTKKSKPPTKKRAVKKKT
jgi:hypothetical protein